MPILPSIQDTPGQCSPCYQLFSRACGLWRKHHKNAVIGWDYLPLSLVAYSDF